MCTRSKIWRGGAKGDPTPQKVLGTVIETWGNRLVLSRKRYFSHSKRGRNVSNPYGPLIDERKLFYIWFIEILKILTEIFEIKFVSLNTIHKYII